MHVQKISYKFKLMPTKAQSSTFSNWAGACRFLYNTCLEQRNMLWSHHRVRVSYYDQANELKEAKRVEGFEWLKEVPAQCLQQAIIDLEGAFKRFLGSNFGYPGFRRKGQADSFRFPDPKQFTVEQVSRKKAFIKLPKIGKIACRLSRPIAGKIKTATVKRDGADWYICFSCEEETALLSSKLQSTVGIDRGISQTIALSDESDYNKEDLELPRKCLDLRKRIGVLQRRLRLKKKFSKKWHQLQNQIRKLHRKIVRIRMDFLHKISTKLANNHSQVTLEDLKTKNMSASAKGSLESPGRMVKAKSGLNREILFQGWGVFAVMLKYKCKWRGIPFELVNPRMTSQRCSRCLYESSKNRKGKKFCCRSCGFEADADTNASVNIDRAGRAQRDHGAATVGSGIEVVTSGMA